MNSNIALIFLLVHTIYLIRYSIFSKDDLLIPLFEVATVQLTSSVTCSSERKRRINQESSPFSETACTSTKSANLLEGSSSKASEKSISKEDTKPGSDLLSEQELLLKEILLNIERSGQKTEANKEAICMEIAKLMKISFSKWKKIAALLAEAEESLSRVECKLRKASMLDVDVRRQLLEQQNSLILQQEKLSVLERSLSCKFTALLHLKKKFCLKKKTSTTIQSSNKCSTSSPSSSNLSGDSTKNHSGKSITTRITLRSRRRRKRRKRNT